MVFQVLKTFHDFFDQKLSTESKQKKSGITIKSTPFGHTGLSLSPKRHHKQLVVCRLFHNVFWFEYLSLISADQVDPFPFLPPRLLPAIIKEKNSARVFYLPFHDHLLFRRFVDIFRTPCFDDRCVCRLMCLGESSRFVCHADT